MNKYLITSAAALTLLPAVVSAQVTASAPVPLPPAPSANAYEVTPSPASERLDYTLLYNNTFNHADLEAASTAHYSDRQIAKIYKIAKLAHVEFRQVFHDLRDGYSLVTVAGWYGVDPRSLKDVQKEQDEIDAYQSAYAATGLGGAPRPGRVESSIDSANKTMWPID